MAIAGAGLMGQWHARYAVRAGAQVVAIVDVRAARAEDLARRFRGARCYATLDEGLKAGPVDAVHVCTDRESHQACAQAALAAGAHAIVEKPAALSVHGAQRLAEAARAAGRVLCPVHQFPFQRGFRRLLQRRPTLGRLVRVEHVVHSAGGEGLAEGDRRRLLADITPHGFSLLRALLGSAVDRLAWDVRKVTTSDLELTGASDDTDLALTYSLQARPTRNELVVTGTQGTARVNLFHGFVNFETGVPSRTSKLLQPFRASAGVVWQASANLARRTLAREPAYPGLLPLIRGFYASLRRGGTPPISLEELVASAALLERLVGGE